MVRSFWASQMPLRAVASEVKLTLSKSIRALSLAAITLAVASAEEVRLTGRVIDRTSTPILGARIIMKPVGGDQSLQTESDPTGAFELSLPWQGDYAISVDRTSYYLYKSDALRIDTSPFELQVTLESIHELQTSVDVTA